MVGRPSNKMRGAKPGPAVDSLPPSGRFAYLDVARGFAVLWMTAFHFSFDLNHFGFTHQDFYRDPVWTVQRTCILSLFLLCAGFGQGLALQAEQGWPRFWRRWAQIAACAGLVSVGSVLMFPNSWIYFGVLHGMAVMLVVCRLTGFMGLWLWPLGALAVLAGLFAPELHAVLALGPEWNAKSLNWLGLIAQKPITEDYVPLLPWLGVMWWGMASSQWWVRRTPGRLLRLNRPLPKALRPVAWVGSWSLTWYMVHQPLLIGALTLLVALR